MIIVTGLPRSGSSLVMQMLEAGGVEILQDHIREPDIHNPNGYYEYQPVLQLDRKNEWLYKVDDRAVKILAHLVKCIPGERDYDVINVTRDIHEVIQSQNNMGQLKSNEKVLNKSIEYRERLENWLKAQPNIRLLTVNYNEVINDPYLKAREIAGFLRKPMDVEAMARAVDSNLYRNKRDSH